MSDPQPKWRKVLVSGSNAHVAALTASAIVNTHGDAQSPGVEERVLVYNTSSGAFYYTGSYGQGGGGGGSGTPGGNDQNIQFNNGGAFDGDDGFIFDDAQDASLFVDGPITGSNISGSGIISGSTVVATSELKLAKTSTPVGITQENVGGSATMEFTTADGSNKQASRIVIRGNADTPDIEFYTGASGSELGNTSTSGLIAAFGGDNKNFGIGNLGTGSAFVTNTATSKFIVEGNITTTGSAGHITASGNISASATILGNNISASGNIVGTSTTSQIIIGEQSVASSFVKSQISHHVDATTPVTMDFLKSRGTLTSPTTVAQNDYIGTQRYLGYDGSNYKLTSAIRGDIDTRVSVATNQVPGALNFLTTQNGSLNSRMFIDSTGNVGIGSFASDNLPGKLLTVAGDISSSAITFTKHLQLPTTSTPTNGGISFGSPGGDNGFLIDSGDFLHLGYNENNILTIHDTGTNVGITGSLELISDVTMGEGNITASGNISASKALFISTSLSGSHAPNNVVLVNTATGELYHTGSYGSGGGGGGAVTAITNNSNDNVLTATGGTTINGEGNLTFNDTDGLIVKRDAQFNQGQSGIFGGNPQATSYKAGQFLESSQLRTYVTPQKNTQRMGVLGVALDRNGRVVSTANYIRYTSSLFFDPTTGGDGGHGGTGDDGTLGTIGRIQVADENEKTGITISGNPGIFFFNNDASASVSGSFNFDSASAHIKFDTGSSGVQFLTGETTQTLTQTLFLSQSGGNATIGVGTTTPESVFDIQEVANNSTGTRILLKSARSSTEGAQVGDSAGSIFFAIDSASFGNVFDTGSVAEITTEVTALLNTGNSLPDVAGNIQLKSSPPHNETLNTVATVGHFPQSFFNPLGGTVDQSAALLISGGLLVDPYLSFAQGNAVALRVKNVKDASGLGNRSDYNDVFVITGSNAVLNSGSLVVGSGSVFLASATADSTTHYGTGGGLEFVNFRGQGPIKLGQVSSTGMGGATQLDFYTGDTQRTRLDGSGNFGIGTGTRTLSKKLEVEGQISASGTITGNSIVGTLATAAQTNITSLGTLTSLTVDNLNLDSNAIASTGDSDVFISLGTAGFDFEANAGDKFIFNTSNQNNVDFQVSGENDLNLIYADASADKVGIGTSLPGEKLTIQGNISASGTITGNSIVGTVGTATQGTIDHDSLANFVANEHIDHSGVTITAGDGLTGGGTIASTRTLAVGAGTGVTVNSNDVAIGQDVATTANVEFANITASLNISASGTLFAGRIHPNGPSGPYLDEVSSRLQASSGFKATTELVAGTNITASGNISASGDLEFENRLFNESHATLGSNGAIGDIVKFGNSSTVAGGLYYLNSSGGWSLTLASAAASSTGSLAVALGSNSTTDGMCLRGFINPFADPGASVGSPVYVSDAASGRIVGTAPSSTGDVVRIVGHQYGTDLIYFNPSNDFIIHA